MARADLNIRIGGDLSALSSALKRAEGSLKRFGNKAESIGRDLTTRVSLPILAIGATAVKTFADFDRLEKGLSALSGSAAAGAAQFDRLNAIVLDTRTTLDLKTAALAAQRLQTAGLSAAEAERTIKQLGIAATVSGSAIDDVGGVVRQFGQIIGKGKIEQEDLNTILDRMPAIGGLIKKEFGASTAEGIRATGISMDEFVLRLTAAIEQNETFQNIQGGLAKSFESFGNAVSTGIRPLGEAIAKALNLEVNLQRLGDFVGRASQAFADLNPNVQRFVVFALAGAAAIGPLSFVLGSVAKVLPLLSSGFGLLAGPIKSLIGGFGAAASQLTFYVSLMRGPEGAIGRSLVFADVLGKLRIVMATLTGPIGLIILAVALIVAGFIKAYKNSEFFRNQIARLGQVFVDLVKPIGELITKIFPSLKGAFKSVGDVFGFVFSGIGALISVVIEAFLILVDLVKAQAGVIKGILTGDLKAAGQSVSDAFELTIGGGAGERLGSAFVTTFSQSFLGGIKNVTTSKEVRDFLGLAGGLNIPSAGDLPVGIAAPTSSSTGGAEPEKPKPPSGPRADPTRNLPAPVQQIGLPGPELTSQARKEIGAFFQEAVLARVEAESLQRALGRLEITPGSFATDPIERMRAAMSEVATEIKENLGVAFEETDAKARFFGEGFDALSEKITITKDALKVAYEEGFLPTDEVVVALTEKLVLLQEQQDGVTEKFGAMSSALETLRGVSSTAFDAVSQAMSKGESAVKAFGNAVLSAVRDAIAAEIKLAVATQVASALKSVPFPFNVGLAAAAGAGASALFTSALNALNIPALASGGITTGAQLALIGEAGPEAVVPLDRLESMINMGGRDESFEGGQVQFIIRGEDLISVMDRARPGYNRAF